MLASQAGVALERARLHRQEKRRLQMEQELTVAKQIQLTLVPSHPPQVPGWSFAAAYQAARQVGGDFYDFMNHAIADGRLGLAIADVTGKGVPAALMMAYSRAVLRAGSMDRATPVEVLEKSNQLIMQERHSGLFVSAFYARSSWKPAGWTMPVRVTTRRYGSRRVALSSSSLKRRA